MNGLQKILEPSALPPLTVTHVSHVEIPQVQEMSIMDALWSDILEILWRNPGDILKKCRSCVCHIVLGCREILVMSPSQRPKSPIFPNQSLDHWLFMVPQIGGIGDIQSLFTAPLGQHCILAVSQSIIGGK